MLGDKYQCFQKVTENVAKEKIKGIGFDATCSLVVLDDEFNSVAVSNSHTGKIFWGNFFVVNGFSSRSKIWQSVFHSFSG